MTTKKKRKILHIAEAFGGGIYTFLVPLMNNTAEKFDVTLAYALRPQTPADYREEIHPDVRLIKGKHFVRSLNPIQDILAFFEIRRIVRQVRPDVIHLHSSKSGFIGRMAINCKKYTVYYTPHGYSFLMQDNSALKRKIYRLMEKAAACTHCTTIAVSKGEYETAKTLSDNVLCINNGISVSKQSSPPAPVNHKQPALCTMGRICFQKNPGTFNRIALALPDLHFTWIGDGELRAELTAPNITVTGWLKREQALRYLNQSDLFLLPSLWEGLPISLLEAMYAGKPCIASRVIGNRDVIRHGENGFLADSPAEYAEIIRKIQSGIYDLNKITDTAYHEILKEYNTDVMSRKYVKLYLKEGEVEDR